ncbi:hypothetical protein TRAPUB_2443 [Trametes pubescens]|uniref:BTB domain-containing protein n=1 Tax=Trametes pubescens TaxID=154538 RepID=A0A1M2VGL7_TRAPU|nr:hypothetical protein TRAPUB_2443 [Trametes pubescens]
MLSLPQPAATTLSSADGNGTATRKTPIVPVPEDSTTLEFLLRLVYPISKSRVQMEDPQKMVPVLQAATKYEMELPVEMITKRLCELVAQSPLQVWAAACRTGFEDVARQAAIDLRTSWARTGAEEALSLLQDLGDMSGISAGDYLRLKQLLNADQSVINRGHLALLTSPLGLAESPTPATPPPFSTRLTSTDVTCRPSSRRGPEVLYPAHRVILSVHSPVLETRLAAQEVSSIEITPDGSLLSPIILDFDEDSDVVSALLKACYDGEEGLPTDLESIAELLRASKKYQMMRIECWARAAWDKAAVDHPLEAYCVAVNHGLRGCAAAAARNILARPIADAYAPVMDVTPALAYHRLLNYHDACRQVVRERLGEVSGRLPAKVYIYRHGFGLNEAATTDVKNALNEFATNPDSVLAWGATKNALLHKTLTKTMSDLFGKTWLRDFVHVLMECVTSVPEAIDSAIDAPQPFPYRDDHYGAPASAPHRESEHVRFDGPERGYPRDDYNEPRRGSRGGPRERRRGGRGRGRWDDRDHFRDRSREFARDPRPRRSRSGSPPGRYGGPGPGPRDARPYSPPPPPGRRDGYGQYGQRPAPGYGPGAVAQASGGGEPELGKDEFGRDLRPESPRDSDTASVQAHQQRSASPLPLGTGSVSTSDRGSVASENAHPAAAPYPQPYPDAPPYAHLYPAGSPVSPPPISPSTSQATAPPLSPVQQHRYPGAGGALEGFDRASFDPSDPASWETLGKAWTATHATMPTQQDLMQFVLGGAAPPAPQQASGSYGAPPPQQQQQQQHQRFQSPPNSQPPPPQQYSQQPYEDDGGPQWQGPDSRQWNTRSQDPRGGGGGWRGGPGGGGGRDNFGGAGRARARGRGDFGRGGYGRGDPGRRGFGREDHGRGDYGGHGHGRGAYSAGGAGHHEQDTDAVVLGGGDDHSWPGQHEHQGPSYGLPPQAYQDQLYREPPPPVPAQPQFQPHAQGPPLAAQGYNAPPMSHEAEGGGGGGGLGGRMQKVGDKWVFVRSAA